jgi:DNA-binding response OmpR family regulator
MTTILLVDDDEGHRYTWHLLLEREGFHVWEAASGTEALHAANAKPDLVVLDVHLPDVSGLEVCRRLKSAPATAAIPILSVTASHPGSQERLEALAAGADGYLTRPVDPAVLFATLRALLRRASGAAA